MFVREPRNRTGVGWFVVVYGLSDSGKTHLMGTAQDCEYTSPALLVDIDQGDLTLSGQDMDVAEVHGLSDLQAIYEYLNDDNDRYNSVLLDGLTSQEADVTMPAVLGSPGTVDLNTYEIPALRDWNSSIFHTKRVLKAFRSLSKHPDPDKRLHVFATALERVDERRDIGVPSLPGSLGMGLGAYVDVLARLTVTDEGKEVRTLHSTSHVGDDGFKYLGKNRLRLLPKRMKNPTIERIMHYLVEEERRGKAPV